MSQDARPEQFEDTARKLAFGRFELDFSRGSLRNDQRDIPLSPKAFALLACLAREPGRWVSRLDACEEVWPALLVDEDTLQPVLAELRRALNDPQGRVISVDAQRGLRFDMAEAPPERRRGRGAPALRFRWKYGLLAPLLVATAFAAIWLVTSRLGPGAARADVRPSIAILPFRNQSDGVALEPRADQFTRDLIATLASEPSFTVKTWEEVSAFKSTLAQTGEIARVLEVKYQVEGSVRFEGGQLRVSAQLADLQGKVLWSARYVEPEAGQRALQERLSREIVGALNSPLGITGNGELK